MACLNPRAVWFGHGKSKNGKKQIMFHPPSDIAVGRLVSGVAEVPDALVPCGRCILCRDFRRRQWQKRLRLELFNNPDATFVTLTYDDDHCPLDVSKSDVQKFIKRFRQIPRDYNLDIGKFKYFFVSEYGSRTTRPHYHGIIFGVDMLLDRLSWQTELVSSKRENGRIFPVYSSAVLSDVWSKGFVSVDSCNSRSIKYVCKYMMKTADDDGWLCDLAPNFYLYSRRLGTSLFLDDDALPTAFAYDSIMEGRVLIDRYGKPEGVPKYLDRYFELNDPDFLERVKAKRRDYVMNSPDLLHRAKAMADGVYNNIANYKRKETLT